MDEVSEITKMVSVWASGDLTYRYEVTGPDEDTREIYEKLLPLTSAACNLVTSLGKRIRDINEKMPDLANSADVATSSVEDASMQIQKIAQSAGKVNEIAQKSTDGVNQIQQAMQDMSAAVEEITASMESVSILSKETNDLSQNGAKLAGSAEMSMDEITAESAKVYEIVLDVEKQMGEISKIVVLIRDLASQTNLLALNAAIEAARAGDAGRGFAVVASEVKSLAQESRNSAERIEEMIGTLKKSTQNASLAMVKAKSVIEQGSQMVTETLHSFNKIAEAVEKVATSASEVAAATEEQAATTEEITASIHEVASLVDQAAKEADEVASASEMSSAAIDEIIKMVHSINSIALKTMEANNQFKGDCELGGVAHGRKGT
jgi:methyl-accepting chemotaxis protein